MTDIRTEASAGSNGQPPPTAMIYVIDDNSELRKSLHFLLATMKITAWPFSGAEDFLAILPSLEPAPILLDIRMPDMSGIECLTELAARNIRWPVIVMSAHGDIAIAVSAMKLGAIEFLEKPFEAGAIDIALNRAFAILSEITRTTLVRDTARKLFGRLTPREAEVVTELMKGLPNKVVAHRLSLSTRTVEMHRATAMGKLGIKSIAEAIAIAGGLASTTPQAGDRS